MKISKKDNYLLIENDTKDLTQFISELTRKEKDFSEENIVINLSSYKDLSEESLMGFLEFSSLHQEKNKSFVIINDAVGIDDLPDELVVVPTRQEAEDIIQMDEIQRDLGF